VKSKGRQPQLSFVLRYCITLMKHVGLSEKNHQAKLYINISHHLICMIILFGTRISPSGKFLSKPKYLALNFRNRASYI
jgi:hypothetical protein